MTDEPVFSDEERTFLKRFAGAVISEAPERHLPGADDDEIFAGLFRKASSRAARVQSLMNDFLDPFGGVTEVSALDDAAFNDMTLKWQGTRHPFLTSILALIGQAYYEDPRVLGVYDKNAGAPFPDGRTVEQGDWSLLDNVRGRAPIYRPTPSER